jgi:1,2-dihydroxy-3-keto-5-methylthiopentene dioxygenase
MASIRIPDRDETIDDHEQVVARLAEIGIDLERWTPSRPVSPDASPDEILAAYREDVERLMQDGGYLTADVIDLRPDTPNLDDMLDKFSVEHWHDEDEVRFIIEGRGLFHLHPEGRDVLALQVEPGDLVRVPRATRHWFDLCDERRIRAIRLFQDKSGWTPHYTGSGVDAGFQPLCLGPQHIPLDEEANLSV